MHKPTQQTVYNILRVHNVTLLLGLSKISCINCHCMRYTVRPLPPAVIMSSKGALASNILGGLLYYEGLGMIPNYTLGWL